MSNPANTSGGRNLGAMRQLGELYRSDLGRLSRDLRTIWLGAIQLFPIVGAILLVNWASLDGLHVFTTIVEWAMFPFMLPLIAIFYGGPVVVDEIERKTLTYLTLRPIPKPIVFVAKWAAGTTYALGLVVGTLLLLYAVCIVFGGGFGASGVPLLKTILGAALGTATYTAIFAALSALFARGLIASVIYFLVFDLVLGQIPVLKLGTVRFHLFDIADVEQRGQSEMLSAFLSGGDWAIPFWASALIVTAFGVVALGVGAAIFGNRQYKI